MTAPSIRSTTVFVTTSFIGFHQWPEAPDDVKYLRDLHRHRFGVRVEMTVGHDDREVEYHQFKRAIDRVIDGVLMWKLREQPAMSCEALAGELLDHVLRMYGPRRWASVRVDEDGENGSMVEHLASRQLQDLLGPDIGRSEWP